MTAERRWRLPDGQWEPAISELAPLASSIAAGQIERARQRLHGDPRGCLIFPFRDLDLMVGPVRPGRLVFVMANTGQGKTTFLLNLTRRLLRQNVPARLSIDYLGTEQQPDELWTKLACLDARVPADIAINLAWDRWPDEAAIDRVDNALTELHTAYGVSGRIRFVPDKFIVLSRVEQAAQEAAERGAHLLIVDHIDRIETQGDDYAAMRGLVRRMKELARDCDIVLVVASQANRKAREGDRLAAYRPPRIETMRGGGVKEEEADVVLGLFRPIQDRPPQYSAVEWVKQLGMVRKGELPASEIVSPDRMGISLLKHRTRSNEGAQCSLHVDHGALYDPSERYQIRQEPPHSGAACETDYEADERAGLVHDGNGRAE